MGPTNFALLVLDDVKYALPDDKLCKGGGVRDVLVILPINNGVFSKVPDD